MTMTMGRIGSSRTNQYSVKCIKCRTLHSLLTGLSAGDPKDMETTAPPTVALPKWFIASCCKWILPCLRLAP